MGATTAIIEQGRRAAPSRLSRYGPLVAALLVLWLAVAGLVATAVRMNGGSFTYALDDAYIHLAMAKNLSQYGVWGTTRYEFSSSSSSLLWTMLLAGLNRVIGINDLSPFLLNLVLASLLVAFIAAWLHDQLVAAWLAGLMLLGIVLVTPLPALIVSGQEHILQALLVVAFTQAMAATLADERGPRAAPHLLWLCLLAALTTLVRYEGLFLIAAAGGLALLRGRWRLGLAIGLSAALPILVYGLISVSQGWLWLPNSVVLKNNFSELSGLTLITRFLGTGYRQIREAPHILFLCIMAVALVLVRLRQHRTVWEPATIMLTLFVVTSLLHMQLAKIGWFFRYEAYLVTLGLVAVARPLLEWLRETWRQPGSARDRLPRYVAVAALVSLVSLPFVERAKLAMLEPAQIMHERLLEHVYPAWFVRQYYNDEVVVINDIGTISYFTDARVLDLFGLASREPVAFRNKPGGYTKADARDWARQRSAKIAILQVEWSYVKPRIPDEWVKVGEWELPSNLLFGDTTIGFFAVDPAEADQLAARLREFGATLPRGIKQSGRLAAP